MVRDCGMEDTAIEMCLKGGGDDGHALSWEGEMREGTEWRASLENV